jgi:low temperature requirement protein LtrA
MLTRLFNILWIVLFSMSLVIQIQQHDTVFIVIHGIVLFVNVVYALWNKGTDEPFITINVTKTENKEW